MKDLADVKPEYPDTSTEDKIQGKDIHHAPQPVTLPVSTVSWTTSGGLATHLDASNATALNAMQLVVYEMYNALLKEGLIKKK